MNSALNQEQMNALAQAQAAKLRVARRALPSVIGHNYVDSVEGHQLADPNAIEMSVRPNQRLQPLQISRRFVLQRGQANDTHTLKALITRAAADLAFAEDAVILHGPDAADRLRNVLHVTFDDAELPEPDARLLPAGAPNIGGGANDLLNSITAGIGVLQDEGYYGNYYVIVSPSLYRDAYRNREAPMSAPIYQIQPLLANNGFLSSGVIVERRGVIFSLARETISLAVPVDTYVDRSLPNDVDGRPRFRVAQQFRLIVDHQAARVALA